MALHGKVQVNTETIASWSAERVENLASLDEEHLYIATYAEHYGGAALYSWTATVSHRYNDGGPELARKVLQLAESGWGLTPDQMVR
jgi:hypothetical protein